MPPADTAPTLWLESSTGARTPLSGPISIGRSRSNTIPIQCERASRRHAVVRLDGAGQCMVMDLGSSNGTFLNGTRVNHTARAELGDLIEIGSEHFVLCSAAGAEGPAAASREGGHDAQLTPSWILIADKQDQEGRTEEADDYFKTVISWAQVCGNIMERNRAELAAGFEGKAVGYWCDPQCEPAIAEAVAETICELQAVQARQGMSFRLALHYGTVVIGAGGAGGRKPLIGMELNHATRMQRMAWDKDASCVISDEADRRIAPHLASRRIERISIEDTNQFYSLRRIH